jgi:hypothetical protein
MDNLVLCPRNSGTPEIAPSRLKGFLQTPWHPTLEKFRQQHHEAIDQVAAAMAAYAKAEKGDKFN